MVVIAIRSSLGTPGSWTLVHSQPGSELRFLQIGQKLGTAPQLLLQARLAVVLVLFDSNARTTPASVRHVL